MSCKIVLEHNTTSTFIHLERKHVVTKNEYQFCLGQSDFENRIILHYFIAFTSIENEDNKRSIFFLLKFCEVVVTYFFLFQITY